MQESIIQKVIFPSKISKLQKANLQFTGPLQTIQNCKAFPQLVANWNQQTHNYYRQLAHLARCFLLIMQQLKSKLSSLMGLQIFLLFSFHFFSRFSMLPLFLCLFSLSIAFIFIPSQQLIFLLVLMQQLYLQLLIFSFFLIILVILFSFFQVLFSFKFHFFFLPQSSLKF